MVDSLDSQRRVESVGSAEETRRRRREGWLIGITAVLFVVFAILEMRLPEFINSSTSNVLFFLLINLNLILLVLLVFLVTRNLLKLIIDRRRGIVGARLRTRLVLAFVSLTLFPTVLLFLVAEGFLSRAIDSWFGASVENALQGSLKVAHSHYQKAGNDTLHFAKLLAQEIKDRGLLDVRRRGRLEQFLERRRSELNVAGIEVLFGQGLRASAVEPREAGKLPPLSDVDRAAVLENGQEFAGTQPKRRGDVVRAGVPLFGENGAIAGAVIVDTAIPRGVSKAARRTAHSSDEFRQLRVLKQPIRNGYTLTFFLITLVVLFCATWFGFYFAKGISVPIQRLGEGMQQVAQGNWDFRAQADGDEEVVKLVNAFNRMTSDLETIHSTLEERRRYIENILANISAGVVSVDRDGAVATVNPIACTMLGLQPEQVTGQRWRDVFARPELKAIADLVARFSEGGREKIEQQIKLAAGVRPLTAWVTATKLTDESGETHGFILFFEDVTQLLRVERMEAWREVARRIAHEIKNPLTPIQLSAQRLRKRYGTTLPEDDRALFDECTRTIVGQVDQLKRLVNEFSTFARLPAVEVAPNDLNGLVEEALVLFREAHPNIHFSCVADRELPQVEIDRDAVKRAIVNLLDNAVAACQATSEPGRVEVVTALDAQMGVVRLEVADNGCGMTADVKARAFEPYYSTKKDGTGLGLAIVSAIMADHHAYVRVRDNQPRGIRLVIEFPLRHTMSLRAAARA